MVIPFSEFGRLDRQMKAAVVTGAINRLRVNVPGMVRTRVQVLDDGIRISIFEHRQTELAKLARSILNTRGPEDGGEVMIFGDTFRLKRWKFDAIRWCWCVAMPGEGTILADRVFDWI